MRLSILSTLIPFLASYVTGAAAWSFAVYTSSDCSGGANIISGSGLAKSNFSPAQASIKVLSLDSDTHVSFYAFDGQSEEVLQTDSINECFDVGSALSYGVYSGTV